jgi:hypothetical protein
MSAVWFCWVEKFMYYQEACLCVGINFIICNKRPMDSAIYVVLSKRLCICYLCDLLNGCL